MKRVIAFLVILAMIIIEFFSGIENTVERNNIYDFELNRELIENSDVKYIEMLSLSTVVDPGNFILGHFTFSMDIDNFSFLWNSDYPSHTVQVHDLVTDERKEIPVEPSHFGGGLESNFSLQHVSNVIMAAYVTQVNKGISLYTIDASLELSSIPNNPVLKTFHNVFYQIESE